MGKSTTDAAGHLTELGRPSTGAECDQRITLAPYRALYTRLRAMGSLANAQINVIEPAEERAAQKSYWADHSVTASVEAMMLDSQAAVIDKEERPEVKLD